MEKLKPHNYHCKYCGCIIVRISNKKWVKSYCETAGKMVRVTLIEK